VLQHVLLRWHPEHKTQKSWAVTKRFSIKTIMIRKRPTIGKGSSKWTRHEKEDGEGEQRKVELCSLASSVPQLRISTRTRPAYTQLLSHHHAVESHTRKPTAVKPWIQKRRIQRSHPVHQHSRNRSTRPHLRFYNNLPDKQPSIVYLAR